VTGTGTVGHEDDPSVAGGQAAGKVERLKLLVLVRVEQAARPFRWAEPAVRRGKNLTRLTFGVPQVLSLDYSFDHARVLFQTAFLQITSDLHLRYTRISMGLHDQNVGEVRQWQRRPTA